MTVIMKEYGAVITKELTPGCLIVTWPYEGETVDIIEYTHQDPDSLLYHGNNLTKGKPDFFDAGNIQYIIKEK